MNCTYFYVGNRDYVVFQNVAYLVILFIGLLVNIVTVVITVKRGKTCCCSTSKLFLSSYAGNICALISLAVNGVYDFEKGVPDIKCQPENERHFLLFLGFTVNMAMLVNSTYNRYKGVSNFKNKIVTVDSNKNLFVRYALPAWIVSAVVATLSVLIRDLVNKFHHFFVCEIISIVPILVCIALNIHLKLFLNKMQRNAKVTSQNESLKKIKVAISMLRITAICHIVYLVIGAFVFYFLNRYSSNRTVFIILDWVSRLLFDLTFTIEAKAFLLKHSWARQEICQFFKRNLKRGSKRFNQSVQSFVTETSISP